MGFALTFNLTKNLIRSGLKFNHWLKEVIPGAIGGWCPLCLIAPYLYPSPSLSDIRNAYLFLQFHSFFFLSSANSSSTLRSLARATAYFA